MTTSNPVVPKFVYQELELALRLMNKPNASQDDISHASNSLAFALAESNLLAGALRKHQEDMDYSPEDRTSYVVEEGSAIYERIVMPEFLPEHLPFAPWDLRD